MLSGMNSDFFQCFIKFVAFWIGVMYVFAKVGGWNELSRKYRCNGSFKGNWKGWQSGRFGVVDYCNCLWLGIVPEGLHLKMGPLFFFRLFHPPLFIPWVAIESVEEHKYWWTWTRVLVIKLVDSGAKIMFAAHALDGAHPFLGNKLK
jgi:hypothetical protein